MKVIAGILLCAFLLVVAAGVAVFTGAIDVAATRPHSPAVAWLLDTAMRRSVETRAREFAAQGPFTEAQIQSGFAHFRETCVGCHGAPGVARSAVGEGLRPQAPSLDQAARHWELGELFWIVKHGIAMTGMPAWGPTHDDEALWNIVAFLEELPEMSADEYRERELQLIGGSAPAAGDEP